MRVLVVAVALAAQTATPIFRFEADGFWLNLHHFLYVLGRAQNGDARQPSAAPWQARRPIRPQGLKGLSDADRQAWGDAVSFYANGLSKQDAVFDREPDRRHQCDASAAERRRRRR